MTLSSKTKSVLSIGTKLKAAESTYIITTMWTGANGKTLYLTIQDTKTHRTLYGEPASHLYGMEIVKEN